MAGVDTMAVSTPDCEDGVSRAVSYCRNSSNSCSDTMAGVGTMAVPTPDCEDIVSRAVRSHRNGSNTRSDVQANTISGVDTMAGATSSCENIISLVISLSPPFNDLPWRPLFFLETLHRRLHLS